MILITGGAGFIGSNFIHLWLNSRDEMIVNLDALTYAGNLENLAQWRDDERHVFVHGDINDKNCLDDLFATYKFRAIIHFAAETHVDRSIDAPSNFIQTNISGTFNLLEAAHGFWQTLSGEAKDKFRFVHISTDEVYGTLREDEPPFCETTPYQPRSPYAASKAASNHLVNSYHHTYGLPVVTTNCSNNYGPFQFPEKFIPLLIHKALSHQPLPIYGDGHQIRDWLHVEDHCRALMCVLEFGCVGEVYNIGGHCEKRNIDVAHLICQILQDNKPLEKGHYTDFISHVTDRPGHDRRYAIDTTKIQTELGWQPIEDFSTGLEKNVKWYFEHKDWVENIISGAYTKTLAGFSK